MKAGDDAPDDTARAMAQALLDALPDAACIETADGAVLLHNTRFTELVALGGQDVTGRARASLLDALAQRPDRTLRTQLTRLGAPDGTSLVVVSDVTRQLVLERAQRMESVGQLSGGIAHDFNNLLAVIMGALELLRRHSAADARSLELVEMAHSAAQRGATLVERLLALARRQTLRPEPTDVARLVTGMLELLRRSLGEAIEIETELSDDLGVVKVDAAQLENTLLNLVINARDAMPEGGILLIEARNESVAPGGSIAAGDYVRLTVKDTGEGIAAEHLGRVFEPFFTTKQASRGTGLGLSSVYGFVTQSHGHVTIESTPGTGTTVRVHLPCAAGDSAPLPEPEQHAAPRGDGERVLVVEDDDGVRAVVLCMLDALGYVTEQAASAPQAFERLGADTKIDLLLTDIVLGGTMSGTELAREARRRRPELRALYMSGYSARAQGSGALVGESAGTVEPDPPALLAKPFTRVELALAVRSALDRGGVRQ